MYLNTRIFPTTGYARVPLFMFIRRELGGTVQEVYFSLHTVTMVLRSSSDDFVSLHFQTNISLKSFGEL